MMLSVACLVAAYQPLPLALNHPRFTPRMCERPVEDETTRAWDAITADLKKAVQTARGMRPGTGADALDELDDFALRAIQRLENRFGANPSGPSLGGFRALTEELTASLEAAGTALTTVTQKLSSVERELKQTRLEMEEGRQVAASTVSTLDDALEKAQDNLSSTEKAMRSADDRATKAEGRTSKADAAAAQATAAAIAAAEEAAAAKKDKAETEARMQALVTAADRRMEAAEEEVAKLLHERDTVLEEEAARKYNRKRERLRRAFRRSREGLVRVLGR